MIRNRPGRPARRLGATLTELMVTLAVTGILAAMAAPRLSLAIERSRADLAAAHLRAIWAAERVWRLDSPFYVDLATLVDAELVDPTITSATTPYAYEVTSTGAATFRARATRTGSTSWTGWLTIDADGAVDGQISRHGIPVVEAGYLFSDP